MSNGPSLTLSVSTAPAATVIGTSQAQVTLIGSQQPAVSLGAVSQPIVQVSMPPSLVAGFVSVPQTQFSVSGSNPQMFLNVMGLGGTIAFLSGQNLVISGFGGSLAGVSQGELEATGTQIGNSIGSLSGYLAAVSGGLQAEIVGGGGTVVRVTGSSPLANAIFTGIGGTLVFISGGFIVISGGAGGGGAYDPLGTAASTGQILYNDIVGLSGQASVIYATLGGLTQSGVIIEGQISSLSGWAGSAANLIITGSNLYGYIIGLSGNTSSLYATIANLTLSGVAIENQILSLSGWAASAINTAATGAALYNDIISLSGVVTGLVSSAAIDIVTGNSFNIGLPYVNYTWSGASGVTGIGILPSISTSSGTAFYVKSKSTTWPLIVSGNINNTQNFTIYPLSSFGFQFDGQTWNTI
jgi:hypothetical protein